MIEKNEFGRLNEKVILVGLISQDQDKTQAKEYIDELEFLSETAGAEVVGKFFQKLPMPNRATFVGSGKLNEILNHIKIHEANTVIFDDELTPTQLRNIEKILACKVLDRTNLILDIFVKRAQTAHAKTQVELAQYQYMLPRLTKLWTHLERQRGGTGTRGGAGEKEIETDKRNIRKQINVLKGRLEKIDKQNATQRKMRSKVVRVALVGYTNVGKSTLMTLLSKSKVHAENKLFATVDATVRKVVLNRLPFLLSDTVGFIRKLPHHLIESFKSTLDEVSESDILLHIVDYSHPLYLDQMEVVNQTLAELGAADKTQIIVYNKIDLADPEEDHENIEVFEGGRLVGTNDENVVYISAKNKTNIEDLKTLIYKHVKEHHLKIYPNYLEPDVY